MFHSFLLNRLILLSQKGSSALDSTEPLRSLTGASRESLEQGLEELSEEVEQLETPEDATEMVESLRSVDDRM